MMKLTRERKVYAAVLGLGVAVLAVDRVFVGGNVLSPEAASAASPAPMDVPLPTPPVSDDKGIGRTTESVSSVTLAARLEHLRQTVPPPLQPSRTAGLFSTEAPWIAPPEPPAPEKPEAAKVTLKDVLARHRITGVIHDQRGNVSFVVVDGAQVGVGESFDGVRVIHVERGAATFEFAGERHREDFLKRDDAR